MKNPVYKFRSTYLLLLLIIVGVFSCKKDDDPTPTNGVEGNWNISKATVNPGILGATDFLQLANFTLGNSDCLTRITFNFRENGTIGNTIPQGCEAAIDLAEQYGINFDEQTTWKIENNKIILTKGSASNEYDLVEVNNINMTWAFDRILPVDSQNHRYTIEFTRK